MFFFFLSLELIFFLPTPSGEAEKAQTTPRSPPPPTSSSAGPHGRTRSEGALQMSQPLPPIKVPSNDNNEEDEIMRGTGGSGKNLFF